MKTVFIGLCALLIAGEVHATRRALLVGINDYSASRLGTPPAGVPQRGWNELTGAVTDVEMLQEMLVLLYGVDAGRIVSLTDQQATRAAILQSLETLIAQTQRGDVVLFYFGGHGSQDANSLSDERDKLDEAIVPADSRLGARDIRDKELRQYFNRIIDRGGRLTAILDSCYSGSGARGLVTGAHPRRVRPDRRDLRDRSVWGPKPEDRGALVLSATQDHDQAFETRDEQGRHHGVFTWAWIRAMRDAAPGEPALQTFLRAQARMRAEAPFQSPVIAGSADATMAPFLGTRVDRRDGRAVVAVSKVQGDSVMLQGGWANGLAAGAELRDPKSATRLQVTAILGLGRSAARVVAGPPPHAGALVEVDGWVVPPGAPLRVCVPRDARDTSAITAVARKLNAAAARHGVHWVANPVDSTASLVLRWGAARWELVRAGGAVESIGDDAAAVGAVGRLPRGTSLFVQLPASADVAHAAGAESVGPEQADYLLVGRYSRRGVSYAWMRPLMKRSDRRWSGLPLQTAWVRGEHAPDLARALTRLRRIHAWLTLESPPAGRFPYHLQLRRERDARLVGEGESVVGGDAYAMQLRAALPLPEGVKPRYVYAFVIDSSGKSTLLFPERDAGSVENEFPDVSPAPPEITLPGSLFEPTTPYGVDTYLLLTTDEPLPTPAQLLEWNGVRAPPASALARILALTASGSRSGPLVTPATWSIERVPYESVRPRRASRASVLGEAARTPPGQPARRRRSVVFLHRS